MATKLSRTGNVAARRACARAQWCSLLAAGSRRSLVVAHGGAAPPAAGHASTTIARGEQSWATCPESGRSLAKEAITALQPPSASQAETLKRLERLAAANTSSQVLEAISKTALLLRDTAVNREANNTSTQALQDVFQNGYDTLVALIQALPQCSDAYSPPAVIPETCVTLFHVHNLLLQAAYASSQDFDVWTELMQAGIGLYLLKAPRATVAFTNGQLDAVLEALARQDLWRLQSLLWGRLLPSIGGTWDSLQDFLSVVGDCEVQAQAAASAAAAIATLTPQPGNSARPGAVTTPSPAAQAASASSLAGRPAGGLVTSVRGKGSDWSVAVYASPAAGPSDWRTQPQWPPKAAPAAPAPTPVPDARTAPATAASASVLYDKQAELEEYGSLLSECIRAALESAATRGLLAAPSPAAAARQLLDSAAAFDSRQRAPSAPQSLRYTFIPSADWLSQVAVAGVHVGERLSAAQVSQLLHDLDALAPKPVEYHGACYRWLDAGGQAAVERCVLWHVSRELWTPHETVTVLQALTGKCSQPPGENVCALAEGLLLACPEARANAGLLCAFLQDAVDLAAGSTAGRSVDDEAISRLAPEPRPLSPAHTSLVRVALNRAICLLGALPADSAGARTAAAAGKARAASGAAASTSGASTAVDVSWSSRAFMFETYPRLLQAARRFNYPLEAFRMQEYAAELYNHLATAPGHELVAVGPEGLTRVLAAVATTSCCSDPAWAAAFERACLTLVAVQFSVGYTHPKRWLGLLEAIAASLPFPMPGLVAASKALMVRLCDTRRHAGYFWELLPLMGTLERRAAAASGAGWQPHSGPSASAAQAESLWTPVSGASASGTGAGTVHNTGPSPGARGWRQPQPAMGGAASMRRPSPGVGRAGPAKGSAAAAGSGSGLLPLVPPPDMKRHLVSEEEYAEWSEELGQKLALSMAAWSDQDRTANLSVLGIGREG